ncbi:MAG: twin-arginine translocation pathway signal protein [Rhodobacteraceae bacterium]|nr:twin-arginine translocation pathway signal protein [Paracoccaceae bacterium]
MTRRQTLSILGGGVIAAAAGSAYAVTRQPNTALAPWDMAGQYDDPRKRALSWAVLSPNPHNRQPWLVDLSLEDHVILFVDTDRLLPHTDPFSRQIVIGLGCFLETMTIAAAEDGYGIELELFPDGMDADTLDARPVAVARFVTGAAAGPDPDFPLIPHRRSQKEPYDMDRPLSSETLGSLVASVRHGTRAEGTLDPARVAAMREISAEALRIELETPNTYKESVDLFRIGHREVNANPDGLDFSGPMWEAMHLTGLFTRDNAIDPDGFVFQSGMDVTTGNVRTAMGHIWLTTPGNTRVDQINAGRDWMRLNLATTRAGVGIHPLSQALQEYPEMSALYAQVHQDMAAPGETIQMWARLGYCAPVPRSPRWPLEAKIVHA